MLYLTSTSEEMTCRKYWLQMERNQSSCFSQRGKITFCHLHSSWKSVLVSLLSFFFPFFPFNTKKTSYKTRRTVLTIRYLYYILNNTSLVSILLFPQITAALFCILERFLPCGLPACLPVQLTKRPFPYKFLYWFFLSLFRLLMIFFSTSFWELRR